MVCFGSDQMFDYIRCVSKKGFNAGPGCRKDKGGKSSFLRFICFSNLTNTMFDLSGKIDEATVSAFGRIHQIPSSMGIPFFVFGVTNRDILLDVSRGIGSKLATVDIDIAACITGISSNV